jgi:hypothetical protein
MMVLCPFCASEVDKNDSECISCGQSLRHLKTSSKKVKEEDDYIVFEDVMTDYQIVITKDGAILGREGTIHSDFFKKYEDISRKQISITYTQKEWWVENLSDTRKIQVNRLVVGKGIKTPLNRNSMVRINDHVLFKVMFSPKLKKDERKPFYIICDHCDCILELNENEHIDSCPVCQENGTQHSISHIIPKKWETEFHLPELILNDVRKNIPITIPHQGGVIGSQGNISPEHFCGETISRQHLKITNDSQGWYIENLSRSNTSELNEKYLQPGVIYRIKDKDFIRIDYKAFRVSLKKEVEQDSNEYYVVCNHCGALYWLKKDEKIPFCKGCTDEDKKYDVASIIPTRIVR